MPRSRKVRILATLGPASNTREMISRLAEAGADAFRINMSHGSHKDHLKLIEILRSLEKELERPTTILADRSGPSQGRQSTRDGALLKSGRASSSTRPGAGRFAPGSLPHPNIRRRRVGDAAVIDDAAVLRGHASRTARAQGRGRRQDFEQ